MALRICACACSRERLPQHGCDAANDWSAEACTSGNADHIGRVVSLPEVGEAVGHHVGIDAPIGVWTAGTETGRLRLVERPECRADSWTVHVGVKIFLKNAFVRRGACGSNGDCAEGTSGARARRRSGPGVAGSHDRNNTRVEQRIDGAVQQIAPGSDR